VARKTGEKKKKLPTNSHSTPGNRKKERKRLKKDVSKLSAIRCRSSGRFKERRKKGGEKKRPGRGILKKSRLLTNRESKGAISRQKDTLMPERANNAKHNQ